MYKRNLKSAARAVAMSVALVIVGGCGEPLIRTDVASADLDQYTTVYISAVRVYSEEELALANEGLQEDMAEWQAEFRTGLAAHFTGLGYRVVDQMPASTTGLLIAELDIQMEFGRYAQSGFGGGSMSVQSGSGVGIQLTGPGGLFGPDELPLGGVDSSLTVTDGRTREIKFNSAAETEGSETFNLEWLAHRNFENLIATFPGQ